MTPELLELTRARAGSSYPLDDLSARWVPGTPVVYIGKAEAKVGGLRKRLGQFLWVARSINFVPARSHIISRWLFSTMGSCNATP